jgi:hypothetical protein
MSAPDPAEDFIRASLSALGIEADEVEQAVIGGVHQIFWPAIADLLAIDTSQVEPERCPDYSKAP